MQLKIFTSILRMLGPCLFYFDYGFFFFDSQRWFPIQYSKPMIDFLFMRLCFSHFSSVVSDTLRPHRLQHARLPCPSPTPRAYSNTCPLSWWCYPTISSSVVPFSSCLQSFPASGSFPMSQFFASGSQSIATSASVLPNEYSGLISFRIDWFDLLAVQGTLKSLLQNHRSKASILPHSTYSHIHTWLMEKP